MEKQEVTFEKIYSDTNIYVYIATINGNYTGTLTTSTPLPDSGSWSVVED